MKLGTFFENFDLPTDAPNAATKLRELMLQLAVRGKLASQDPEDESAVQLLEKLLAWKAEQVKKKAFQKSSKLQALDFEEQPYLLPNSWIWTRVRLICGSVVPNRDKPKKNSGGYPWITLSNFDTNDIRLLNNHPGKGLSKEEFVEYNA